MTSIKKSLTTFCFLLSLLVLSGCATTSPNVIYEGTPEGYVLVKKDTLQKLVDELIMTRYQLLECWEKLR